MTSSGADHLVVVWAVAVVAATWLKTERHRTHGQRSKGPGSPDFNSHERLSPPRHATLSSSLFCIGCGLVWTGFVSTTPHSTHPHTRSP